ncbi:hypothetical protein E3T33_10425 [Cryobacterium sp. TMT1-2-1]|nr:hypothetical protein E3T33_10425 [Cryobacterium sp. TMT1-2-1]
MIAVVFAPLLGALVWYFAGPHLIGLRLIRQVLCCGMGSDERRPMIWSWGCS